MDGVSEDKAHTIATTNNAATTSVKLQLVNEKKEFTTQLRNHLDGVWHLSQSGFQYNVVAVFGSQSTGKSSHFVGRDFEGTLLNRLFGTQFAIMKANSRQQTTRGIWMSLADRDESMPRNTLVMDVEGTDGRERGEDQEFERRSALFSLSVAEVVIVNIWENMVGLYNGANMGLLKTVFEVHLQLFQHDDAPKTLLLFVIRDFIGSTPLENLIQVLEESMIKIWSEVSKPAGKSEATLHDFFDFAYAALPHKLLQADKFEEETRKLRRRFLDPSNEQFVFQEKYHKKVPADGFAHYAEAIWDKIITNKDLDLPTQQQLLAQYRCDEISNLVFQSFAKQIKACEKEIETGKVTDDFQALAKIRDDTLAAFSKEASRYHTDVYSRKKLELREKMHAALHLLFLGQLRNLQKTTLAHFKAQVQRIVNEDAENFATRLVQAQTDADVHFRKHAAEAVLRETGWSNEEQVQSFVEELEEFAARIRVEEMEKLVARLLKGSSVGFTESILESMNDASRGMWAQILDTYRAGVCKLSSSFMEKVAGFQASQTETAGYLHTIHQQTWSLFKQKIREEVSDALMQVRLRQRFEEAFRYDDNGLPRVWQKGENMDEVFLQARGKAEELVTLFAKIPIPNDLLEETVGTLVSGNGEALKDTNVVKEDADFDAESNSIVLLPPSRQRDLRDRLKKDADALYLDAKRGAVASLSEVPKGMWLLLFAFGFNEIYSLVLFMLSNPLLLILLVFVGIAGAFLYQSGLLMPVMRTVYASAGPVLRIVLESVVDGMGTMLRPPQAAAANATLAREDGERSGSPRGTGEHTPPSGQLRSSTPEPPGSGSSSRQMGTPLRPKQLVEDTIQSLISLTPFATPVKKKRRE